MRTNKKVLALGVGLLGLFALANTGCASAMAEVPLSDGNMLVISGYGTKAKVSQLCLSEQTIKQLTNSSIPPDVPKSTCYWVQLVSTDSTDVSKAITAFIRADNEFTSKVAGLITTTAPPAAAPSSLVEPPPAGAEIANKILTAAVSQPQDQVVADAKNLAAAEKPQIKAELAKLRVGVSDAVIQKKLDAVLGAL